MYMYMYSVLLIVQLPLLLALLIFHLLRTKKLSIPSSKFSLIVGRNSSNLVLLRTSTGAQIEVEKTSRQAPTRTIVIKLV